MKFIVVDETTQQYSVWRKLANQLKSLNTTSDFYFWYFKHILLLIVLLK